MTIFHAAVFGIIQGLTEFLPISSSAHLALLPWFFGWEDPGLAFDVALHWGTLLGVLLYFRNDIKDLIIGWCGSLRGKREPLNVLSWHIVLATIPAALAGYFLEGKAETVFRSPVLMAFALAGAGILLYWADKTTGPKTPLRGMNWKKAAVIGLAQSLAIIPGVSRSGITTTAGLFLSLDRESSVRFSFLLSMPIIFGAGIKKAGFFIDNLANISFWVAFAAAAVSGMAAIHFLLTFVKKRSFTPFVIYRILLALIILAWFTFSHR